MSKPAARPAGPVGLAEGLVDTLKDELGALTRLAAAFEQQLEAVRTRRHADLEAATLEAHDALAGLGRLQQARERQVRLLGRVLRIADDPVPVTAVADALAQHPGGAEASAALRTARAALRNRAEQTQRHADALSFALQYAIDLGRDMIQALQGTDGAAPARVYTAAGAATQAAPPKPILNRLG